jgi:aerobic-type carbon monoxide dehydrogenase small subunit (CoxS/CutS family)
MEVKIKLKNTEEFDTVAEALKRYVKNQYGYCRDGHSSTAHRIITRMFEKRNNVIKRMTSVKYYLYDKHIGSFLDEQDLDRKCEL